MSSDLIGKMPVIDTPFCLMSKRPSVSMARPVGVSGAPAGAP